MKVACTVWSGGKGRDNIESLPITIIRELATEMLKEVRGIYPTLFKNAGPSCIGNPCPEGKMTCGKITEVRYRFENLI